MASLVSPEEFAVRLGRDLSLSESDRAGALLDDASALVRLIAGHTTETPVLTMPVQESIVPVVCSMVQRALENPRGLSGETLGDHTWQASPSQATIYATRDEKRTIRRAVGKLSVGTAQLEGYLPVTNESWLEGSI